MTSSLLSRLKVAQKIRGLFMHQSMYIASLLLKTNMYNTKLVSTLMSTYAKLMAFDGTTFEDPQLYSSVVGSF